MAFLPLFQRGLFLAGLLLTAPIAQAQAPAAQADPCAAAQTPQELRVCSPELAAFLPLPDELKMAEVPVNRFAPGGNLPARYTGYRFWLPAGTQSLEVAWVSLSGRVQRVGLPARENNLADLAASEPIWRQGWLSRTPLPGADLPWRTDCRSEQPLHLSLGVESFGGDTNSSQNLRLPGSYLNGLLLSLIHI